LTLFVEWQEGQLACKSLRPLSPKVKK